MIHYAQVDSTGRVYNCGSAGGFQSQDDVKAVVPDAVFLDSPIADPSLYYYEDGELKPTGVRPSMFHEFDYTTKEWVLNQTYAWNAVRGNRSDLLRASDWIVTKATETGTAVPTAWAEYRQALRDITNQTDPLNIVWPTPPV